MRYFISQGLLRPTLEVEIDGVPPCLFCGEPVTSPSMDGPLVCGACDCGHNRGGLKWTEAQAEERYAHRRAKVVEYRAQMIDRRVRETKDLLAKMTLDAGLHAVEPWIAQGTYIQTASCFADVCDRDDALFMAIARRLLPDLIELYELRGEEVAKGADARDAAQKARDVLRCEVSELRAGLRTAIEKLRPEVIYELRVLIEDPRRMCGGANQLDYEQSALRKLLATLPTFLILHKDVLKVWDLLLQKEER